MSRLTHVWARIRGARVRIGTCAAGGILAAIAVTSGTAYMTPAAFAADCPAGSSCATANVTVTQTISFAFTSATAFSLDTVGTISHNALTFNIITNDPGGYQVTLAGTDPSTSAGASFPASDLQYDTWQSGADTGFSALANSPAVFEHVTSPTGGTPYAQDWKAAVPGNQAPGTYASTLTFIATGA
jgi:hypothetical protein